MTGQPVLTGRAYIAPAGSTDPAEWTDLGTWTNGRFDTADIDDWVLSAGRYTQASVTLTARLDRRALRLLLGLPPGERWQPRRTTRAQRKGRR